MGGTSSKAEIDQLSQNITTIASNAVMRCQTNINQNQHVVIENTGVSLFSTYKFKQASTISSSCVQDTALQAKIQNDIINAITNSSSAEGVAMMSAFGNTDAEASAKLKNIVQTNVTMNNIMENYNNISQSQDITVLNRGGLVVAQNVEAVQGAEIFAAATLKTVQDAGVLTTIQTKLDQDAAAKSTNPLDFLGNLFGSIALAIGAVIIFFILIIVGLVFFVRNAKSDTPKTAAGELKSSLFTF